MKRRLLFSMISKVMLSGIFILINNVPVEKKYSSRDKSEVKSQDAKGYIRWLYSKRADPLTGSVSLSAVEQARQQADAMAGGRNLGLAWEEMGPNNVGGRTRAFLIDKFDHNRLYAGGVGGGLWYSASAGSSWQRINGGDQMSRLSVASICQSADGYIYFGTGEGLYGNYGDGTGGLQGQGIFKSTQPSSSSYTPLDFVQLDSTWGTAAQRLVFVNVNKMAASPTNPQRIYAATARGLRITDDGGVTWINPLGTVVSVAKDVDVASDGTVLASVNNRGYRSATGDDGSFTILAGGLPTSQVSRIEFAIAPSDPNVMYGSAAKSSNDQLLNVYMSTNKGDNWTIIGPGGTTTFNPLASQGSYDNAVGVAPNNPYKLFIGGLELWSWVGNSSFNGQWTKIDCWNCWEHSVYYTHADKHSIDFDPVNPNIMYIASDGGIAKSTNQGATFSIKNTNYNVTQFYSVAIAPNGMVMGGTQDNGTQFITGRSIASPNDDPQYAIKVSGGDGGFTAISYIYPPSVSPLLGVEVGAGFAATPYGAITRSNGGNFASFYDANIDFSVPPAAPSYSGDFVTPFSLWESRNDLLTNDSVTFRIPDSLSQVLNAQISGNITRANGQINYTYQFQNSGSLMPGSVRITDGVQNVVDNGSGMFTGNVNTSATNTIDYLNRTFDVTFSNPLAQDSVLTVYYKIQYPSGAVVNINSATIALPINYTLPSQLVSGDSVVIQDIIQTRFVAGLTAPGGNCIWMTKRSLDFSTSKPQWFKIASGLSGVPECMVFSKDGNYLFVGTNSGRVYRISGLSQVTDSAHGWWNSSSTVVVRTLSTTSLINSVTGLDVSKSNPNIVIVTTGGYNASPHVYRSVNALSTFTFTSIQNNLPAMPVYDVVINKDLDNQIVLGTDLGVWASDDNGVNWSEENSGMARTAAVMLRQVPGNGTGGMIYAATHGRGIFKSGTLVGINEPPASTLSTIDSRSIKVFPNPMSQNGFADYVLNQNSNVDIEMYDIKGTLIKSEKLGKLASGLHRYGFDAGNLNNGTYFLVVRAGNDKATGRFVLVR
ncbi:MAG: T9SS type A sorting domain-containing protein [Bacteroidia bacterium]|nr:T9SS type A sorting domain-containing protein [Bacteroidia bacterium]